MAWPNRLVTRATSLVGSPLLTFLLPSLTQEPLHVCQLHNPQRRSQVRHRIAARGARSTSFCCSLVHIPVHPSIPVGRPPAQKQTPRLVFLGAVSLFGLFVPCTGLSVCSLLSSFFFVADSRQPIYAPRNKQGRHTRTHTTPVCSTSASDHNNNPQRLPKTKTTLPNFYFSSFRLSSRIFVPPSLRLG